jgi:biopolymer transport protein ExbD
MKWLVGVVLASGCFAMSPVMRFGGGKSAEESQHDLMKGVTPPTLTVDAPWAGAVTVAKIRVYADDDYRAQHVHWQETFQDQLDYANEVLASEFGVRLEPEFRTWPFHSPGTKLDDALAALQREDAGADALSVVGLTTSMTLTATFDQLGLAAMDGHHFVIRGYNDTAERAAFDSWFRNLSATERDTLYVARRRHQNAALFLHELAHNLGAPHRDEQTIMNPKYSDKAASFDPATHEIMLATLDRRLHRTPPASRTAAVSPAPATMAASRPTTPATPGAASPAPTPHGNHPSLVLLVDATGRIVLGGQILDDGTLDGLMRLSFDDDHDTAVVVKPVRAAPQTMVTKVIDRAKAVGFTHVTIDPTD